MKWHHDNLTKPGDVGPAFGLLTSDVVKAAGTQHVFYAGFDNGHIIELSWKGSGPVALRDLTKRGAPVGDSPLISHVFDAEGTQHVFYRSSQEHPGDIYELWWREGEDPHPGDLFIANGGPRAAPALTSHVFDDGTQHVFYLADIGQPESGHIMQVWWQASEAVPHLRDLTDLSEALLPASTLTSHVVHDERTQHVFYNTAGHIIELWWSGGEEPGPPHREDLTDQSARAPLAASAPTSFVDADGIQHVFYIAENGHVIEIWWHGSEPKHHEDLTDQSGAPLPYLGLTGHFFETERTQHVFYRGAPGQPEEGHIIEIWWQGANPKHHEDLTARSGAPLAVLGPGDPISHVVIADDPQASTQHVFYLSTEGVTELWAEM
jgi:hypothetical protein